MLGEYEGKVARHLLGGHAPSIAKAVMVSNDVRDSLFSLFLDAINDECNNLCRKSPGNSSLFRKMPLTQIIDFNWSVIVSELESRAPLLFKAFSSIAGRNDHRNKSKVGAIHHPSNLYGYCSYSQREKQGNVWSPVSPLTVNVLLSL